MASYPPTKDARDKNLQTLLIKVNEWGAKEKMRIENETQFLRSVLMGRQKSNDPGTQNLDTLLSPSGLLQTSINDFILYGKSPGGAPGG
jgi:hypothetical protein